MRLGCDPKRKISQQYNLTEPVGVGGCGVVYLAVHKESGTRRAIKKIELTEEGKLDTLVNEVSMLRQVGKHPNIVQLVDCFVDVDSAYMVVEFGSGGDLLDWMESHVNAPARKEEVASLMRQMIRAVDACHAKGVMHLDLKPDNFVLDSCAERATLKLIDFGCAEVIGASNDAAGAHATQGYDAPEVGLCERGPYTDAWALGISFFGMLTGGYFPQFTAENELHGDSLRTLERFSGPAAVDMCKKLLNKDPLKRLQLEDALDHPFFSESLRRF